LIFSKTLYAFILWKKKYFQFIFLPFILIEKYLLKKYLKIIQKY